MAQWGFSGGTAAVDSREGPYRFGIAPEENSFALKVRASRFGLCHRM